MEYNGWWQNPAVDLWFRCRHQQSSHRRESRGTFRIFSPNLRFHLLKSLICRYYEQTIAKKTTSNFSFQIKWLITSRIHIYALCVNFHSSFSHNFSLTCHDPRSLHHRKLTTFCHVQNGVYRDPFFPCSIAIFLALFFRSVWGSIMEIGWTCSLLAWEYTFSVRLVLILDCDGDDDKAVLAATLSALGYGSILTNFNKVFVNLSIVKRGRHWRSTCYGMSKNAI